MQIICNILPDHRSIKGFSRVDRYESRGFLLPMQIILFIGADSGLSLIRAAAAPLPMLLQCNISNGMQRYRWARTQYYYYYYCSYTFVGSSTSGSLEPSQCSFRLHNCRPLTWQSASHTLWSLLLRHQ